MPLPLFHENERRNESERERCFSPFTASTLRKHETFPVFKTLPLCLFTRIDICEMIEGDRDENKMRIILDPERDYLPSNAFLKKAVGYKLFIYPLFFTLLYPKIKMNFEI